MVNAYFFASFYGQDALQTLPALSSLRGDSSFPSLRAAKGGVAIQSPLVLWIASSSCGLLAMTGKRKRLLAMMIKGKRTLRNCKKAFLSNSDEEMFCLNIGFSGRI